MHLGSLMIRLDAKRELDQQLMPRDSKPFCVQRGGLECPAALLCTASGTATVLARESIPIIADIQSVALSSPSD